MRKTLKFTLVAVLAVAISAFLGVTAFAGDLAGTAIDYKTQTITGIKLGYEYTVDSGEAQYAYGNLDISGYTVGQEIEITDGEDTKTYEIAVAPARPTPTYDGIEEEISAGTGTEYKIAPFVWTPVDASKIDTKHISDTAAATVQIRVAATGSAPASAIATVSVQKRAAAPAVEYKDTTDSITGVLLTMEYTLDDEGKPSEALQDVTSAGITRAVIVSDFDAYDGSATTVYVRVKATGTNPASSWAEISIPATPEDPVIDDIEELLAIDYANETFTVTSEKALEYAKEPVSGSWIALPNGYKISSLIPAYGTGAATIYVRIKAVAPTAASVPEEFSIPARAETPDSEDFAFVTSSELIEAVGVLHQYAVGTGEYKDYVEEAFKTDTEVGSAAKTVYIRVKAKTDAFASESISVAIPKRPAKPSLSYNAATDTVTLKKDTDYLYTNDLESEFVELSHEAATVATRSELITDSPENGGTVYIRFPATETDPVSAYATVTFPESNTQTTIEGVDIDYELEVITGSKKTDMEYRKSSSYNAKTGVFTYPSSWTTVSANDMSITSMIPAATATAPVGIEIRVKATSTTAVSEAIPLVLNQRPAAPVKGTDIAFNGKTEKITLLVAADERGYEYLDENGKYESISWEEEDESFVFDDTPEVGTTATSVKIRYAANSDNEKFASLPLSLSVPARPAAPSVTYSGTTDSATGLSKTTMEYSLTEDGWDNTLPPATTMTREALGLDDDGGIVYVRKLATDTASASQVAEVEFPAKFAVAVPNVSLDLATEKIVGTATTMEYSKDGGKTWTSASKDATNITSVLTAAKDEDKLQVRVKATSSAPASAVKEFTLYARPATPTASQVKYDFANEKIVIIGLDGLEYSVDGGEYDDLADATEVEPSTTAATSIKVRVKTVDTTPASLARTISVPKRAAAPSAAWDAAKSRIKSVTSAMEYSIDDGGTWVSVLSGQTYIEGLAEGTVLVRVKATTSAVHSAEKPITVPAAD
jgi:hypothetical protein